MDINPIISDKRKLLTFSFSNFDINKTITIDSKKRHIHKKNMNKFIIIPYTKNLSDIPKIIFKKKKKK